MTIVEMIAKSLNVTTFDDLKNAGIFCVRVYDELYREFGNSPFSKFLVIGNPLKSRSFFFFLSPLTKGRDIATAVSARRIRKVH